MVYLLALMKPLKKPVAEGFCDRLELTERHRKVFANEKNRADVSLEWMELQKRFRNSVVYRKLRPFRTEVLLYMMAGTTRQEVRRAISNYFTRLRPTATILKGNDLKDMGLAPGPVYRKILDSLLDARLNGQVKTLEDEVGFVHKQWKV
jgi:tRNA nucleotidyltransferase (CCA-adding enzyme)